MPLLHFTFHTWTSAYRGGWRVECACGFKSVKYATEARAAKVAGRHLAEHIPAPDTTRVPHG